MVIKRAFFILILVLFGCGEKWGTLGTENHFVPAPESLFDPLNNKMPFPSDFYLQKGHVVMDTGKDSALQKVILKQVEQLDGFSTLPTISFDFTAPLMAESVNTKSVRLFRLTPSKLIPVPHIKVWLDPANKKTINIRVDLPLREKADYVAVVLDSVLGENRVRAVGSQVFNVLKSHKPLIDHGTSMIVFMTDKQATLLNGIWQTYSRYFDLLEGQYQISREHVVSMTKFTTQDNRDLLKPYYDDVLKLDSPGFLGKDGKGMGQGDVLSIPDFLALHPGLAAADLSNIQGVIEGVMKLPDYRQPWDDSPDAGGLGMESHIVEIPYLLLIPASRQKFHGMVIQCAEPYNTVLFVHRLGGNRYDVCGPASHVAAACHALLSIDLPDHGDRSARDIDGDGVATSGESYIDPIHLLATRANLGQTVIDLFSLTQAVKGYDRDFFPLGHPNGTKDLSGKVDAILGMGIPGGLGLIYAHYVKDLKTIILNAPGGYWRRLAQRSPTLGQRIKLLLAQAMDTELSSRGFNEFYNWYIEPFQWIMDPVDPLNFADPDDFNSVAILYQEVLGDEVSGNGLNNNQPFEPNEVIAQALGLFPPGLVSSIHLDNAAAQGAVRFKKVFAGHNTLSSLSQVAGSNRQRGFYEMAHEVWSILTSSGSQIEVLDREVIEQ